jgi:serine/threonine protein kinase/tetratricopeptide (TPR) repeat protein
MGVVYRGRDPETGATVAVKTVSGLRTERLQGLRAEIIALARVRHPGLVRFIQHGLDGGVPWYAMELLPGDSLVAYNNSLWQTLGIRNARTAEHETPTASSADALSVPGPLLVPSGDDRVPIAAGRLPEVLTIYRRLCLALAYLHDKGFVHRDVKPSNVVIRPDQQPVLLDFGLAARALGAVGRESLETAGRFIGTAPYLAPEQIRREIVDARADLYSVGCMMYETLTGLPPFRAPSMQELCRLHLETPPAPLSELVSGVPPGMEALVSRLLAKTKRHRLGHADDVATALLALGAEDNAGPTEIISSGYLYRPELTGRDDVIKEMELALDRAASGSGGCIVLSGESGVGKTFLASEVARLAGLRRFRTVAGECVPAGLSAASTVEIRSAPLHPFRTLFQAIADSCRQDGVEATDTILGPRGKVLNSYAQAFDGLPGQGRYPEPAELAAEENLRRLIDDLGATLSAFARAGRPLLLILDDLQWADEVTLKFLKWLAGANLKELPLLVLCTNRSEEVGADLEALLGAPTVRRHSIGRLEQRSVGQLIADMLGIRAAPEPFVGFVAQHSEGNPFFVAEYLRAAVADQLVRRSGGSWTFTSSTIEETLERIPVPHSVQEIVGRRLDSVAPEARLLLEQAAVLGREVDLQLLLPLAQMDEQSAIPLVNDLVGRQLFEATPSGKYRFVHDKLREVAYRSIPAARRREMHLAAANAIEPLVGGAHRNVTYAALAHHYLQAEAWSKAVDYFERAGEEALLTFSNREALTYFGSAISLGERLEERPARLRQAKWERGLVEAHLGLGEWTVGLEHADRCLRHCRVPLPKTTAGWGAGLLGQSLAHLIQSMSPGLFRVRSTERAALLDQASYVLNRLFEPLLFANRPLQVAYCGVRNLNLAQRLPPATAFARGYAAMCIMAGTIGPLERVARNWADRSLTMARSLGDEPTLMYALTRSSCFFITMAEWPEAGKRLEEANALAQRIADGRGYEECLAIEGLRLFYSGQFAQSLECGRELLERALPRGDKQTQTWGDNIQVQSLGRLGRHDEALHLVRRMDKWLGEEAFNLDRVYAYGNFAFVFAQAGDLAQATHYAREALHYVGDSKPTAYFILNGLVGIVDAYLAVAEAAGPGAWSSRPDLREGLTKACALLRHFAGLMRFGRPAALLCNALKLCLSGRERAGVRMLERARHWARQLNTPYEEARICLELGRRRPDAIGRGYLQRSRELFAGLDARYDLARTDAALAGRPEAS